MLPLSSTGSPNKLLKSLTTAHYSMLDGDSSDRMDESREPPPAMEESSTLTCGICLSEAGKSIRGLIDSCNHYFCFVCIMEWARVESRCPMCKRRFTTIRRPPKHGVFPCERVVNVPQRDQVYNFLGNATTGPSDPFANTKCSICHSTADESLLLLCDLCDSASHTYCIGLGCTVPEGDWFCHDCAVSRAEHEQSEMETDTDNQHISGNSVVTPAVKSTVSIFSIVQGSDSSAIGRPLPRVSSSVNHLSLPVVLEEESSVQHGENTEGRRAHKNTASKAAESCAKTLRRCRNVRSRIQVIRENWEALRLGSLRFSSSSAESCGVNRQKGKTAAVPPERSGQLNFSSSVSKQTSQDGNPRCTEHKRKSHDVDKAWKMMDIARTIRSKGENSSSVPWASKTLAKKGDGLEQSSNRSSSLCTSTGRGLRTGNMRGNGMEKQCMFYFENSETERHRSYKLKSQKQSWVMAGESSGGFTRKYPSGNCESTSSRKVQTRSDVTPINSFMKDSHQVPKESEYCGLKTLTESATGGFDTILEAKVELGVASSSTVDFSEEKVAFRKDGAETMKRKDDDAKNEIQSLVKLNLKLLSGDKLLGVEVFKKVAWLATHTILAACGLEHPKRGIHCSQSPSPICSHTGQIHELRRSTLMPNSCRECFYVFVKDVVNSIMVEKVGNLST